MSENDSFLKMSQKTLRHLRQDRRKRPRTTLDTPCFGAIEPMPEKALIYVRRSPRPAHALERNETIETQLEICRRYCADKGLTVGKGHELVDEDLSGRTPLAKRQHGKELIELAPRVGNVVCYSLDRIFRNTVDGLGTLERWEKCEVKLHAISQGTVRNIANAQDWLAMGIALLFAEFEPRNGAERTSAAMRRRQATGEMMGGNPPYGLERDPDRLGHWRIEPREYAIRQTIFACRDKYGLSPAEIERRLAAEGVLNRSGGRFAARSIARILAGQADLKTLLANGD